MKRAMIATLVLMLIAAPAFAFHCPKDMAKIDEAMKTAKLSAGEKTQVEQYRKTGDELHKAGKHQESIDTLAKAMAILAIK